MAKAAEEKRVRAPSEMGESMNTPKGAWGLEERLQLNGSDPRMGNTDCPGQVHSDGR